MSAADQWPIPRDHLGGEIPLAALAEGSCGLLDDRRCVVLGGCEQDAELVAAEAVSAAGWLDGVAECVAEPGEQQVACGVAEGVVVALEAVEVEQRQHVFAGGMLEGGIEVLE